MVSSIFYFLLYHSGLTLLFDFIYFNLFRKIHVPILVYHSIVDTTSEKPFSNEIGITVTKYAFEKQMACIKSRHSVIPLSELFEVCGNFQSFRKRPVAITFDDGYYDNYQNAFPILKKYGFTATIFPTTDYVDSQEIFLWNILDFLIVNEPEKIAVLLGLDKSNTPGRFKKKRFIKKLKRLLLNEENIKKILSLRDHLNQDSRCRIFKDRMMLGSREIKIMEAGNMDFGAHGLSHQDLGKLDSDSQEKEILKSISKLQNILGRAVKLFAYPFGHKKAFTYGTKGILSKAGIKYAVANRRGVNNLQTDQYEIKRIIVQDMPLFVFKVRLSALMLQIDKCKRIFENLFSLCIPFSS